jgi:hypothetical protein
MTESGRFVQTVLDRVPLLHPIYQEHVRYYDELIPHVFMGDISRVAGDLHARALGGDNAADEALSELLTALESGMASPESSVQEMITVSFLENLDLEDFALEDFRQRLGPALRRQLERLEIEED